GLTEGKSASTPIDTEKPLLKDPDGISSVLESLKMMLSAGYLTRQQMVISLPCLTHIRIASPDQTVSALVDKKKVVVTEATIRDALNLDDAEGVECLPNEEIFATLARMGYEKPSTKLTFYKVFFSSQWKFLIHTILQSLSAKRTSWNEFSSAMASAVICLVIGCTFNFLRRVGKGCLRVETPLFKGMIAAREPEDQGNIEEQGDKEEQGNGNNAAKKPVTAVDDVTEKDEGAELMNKKETEEVRVNPDDAQVEGRQANIYHIDMDHATKVLISAAAVIQTDVPAAPVNAAACD
nr:hypothetical protein [Tanacetum cinerariifolium]